MLKTVPGRGNPVVFTPKEATGSNPPTFAQLRGPLSQRAALLSLFGPAEGAVCGGAEAGTGEGEATVWAAACSMILRTGDASSPWTSPKSVSAPSPSTTTKNSRCW
ncbi:hypothetical protein GCM10010182_77080 [Actinomadura cremea]|nr:hypothetical protein GCM10010182_77080 [Actinomadura cremea]